MKITETTEIDPDTKEEKITLEINIKDEVKRIAIAQCKQLISEHHLAISDLFKM